MSNIARRQFLGSAVAAALFPAISAAATTPNPPTNLLINGKKPTPVTPAVKRVKWNPGYAILIYQWSTGTSIDSMKNDALQIQNVSSFNRIDLNLMWSTFENAKQGAYSDPVVGTIRDYINNTTTPGLFSQPKRYGLNITTCNFNGTGGTQAVPRYVIDNGWTTVPSDGNLRPDFNNQQCLQAYLNFLAWLGSKFDSDPWLEIVAGDESANGYNMTTYLAVYQAMKTAFPTTNVCFLNNFGPGAQGPGDAAVCAYALSHKIGCGGPDILYGATDQTWGQLAFAGAGPSDAGGNGTCDYGSVDYRGKLPNYLSHQVDWPNQTISEMLQYLINQKCTHAGMTTQGTKSGQTWADTLAAINSKPNVLWTQYPTAY